MTRGCPRGAPQGALGAPHSVCVCVCVHVYVCAWRSPRPPTLQGRGAWGRRARRSRPRARITTTHGPGPPTDGTRSAPCCTPLPARSRATKLPNLTRGCPWGAPQGALGAPHRVPSGRPTVCAWVCVCRDHRDHGKAQQASKGRRLTRGCPLGAPQGALGAPHSVCVCACVCVCVRVCVCVCVEVTETMGRPSRHPKSVA